jgi:hypothetical protein
MKIGVSTSPWGVLSKPVRAADPASSWVTVKERLIGKTSDRKISGSATILPHSPTECATKPLPT